jgi:signal transduction histidine kinase
MTRARRNRRIVLLLSLVPLGVSLCWLGWLVFRMEGVVPLAFYAVVAAIIVALAMFCHYDHEETQRLRALDAQLSRWAKLASRETPSEGLLRDFIRYAPASAAAALDRRPTRLREVVQESAERMTGPLTERRIELRTHQGGDPHVAADREALGHALDKLIAKALHDAGERRFIEIHLTTHGAHAELAVSNVEPYEEFGVAVARQIAEAHGGHLSLEDRALRLRLPLIV